MGRVKGIEPSYSASGFMASDSAPASAFPNAGSFGLDRTRARRAGLSSKSTATDFPSAGPASLGVNLNGQTLTGARCGRPRPGTACARCLSPFFQANIMEVSMILVQRSVSVAPGMLAAAMAFANEIATQVKATTGVDVKIAVPVGGNAARMAWISNYEDLTHYETSARKLLNDQKYMEVIEKAAGIYVANTLHDEIWRTL
jgi:hypothetical protein